MIRQRQRRVSDLRRKCLDEESRDRPVHHRHEHHLNEHQRCECDSIDGIGVELHRVINRDVKDRGEKVTCHHYLLATNPVRQTPEENEQRSPECQRYRDTDVGSDERDLENRLQEEQRVELSRVPDHRLARRRAEQHREKDLPARPGAETLLDRRARRFACVLQNRKERRLPQANPDVVGNRKKQE